MVEVEQTQELGMEQQVKKLVQAVVGEVLELKENNE